MIDNYVIEYLNENEFRKKERAIKKYNMLAYKKQRIIMLDNLTPDDILTEGHQKELTTYKGVMVSKTHADKDIFKINLLNMIEK